MHGPAPPGLLALAEPDLPEPLESLHAVCIRIDRRRVLVCAAPRHSLESIDPSAVELHPAEWPEFIAAETASKPSDLSLLVGDFEPVAIKRHRRIRLVCSLAAGVTLTCLLCVGLGRRADAWTVAADNAADAARRVLTAAMPGESGDARLIPLRMADELAVLRQTRSAPNDILIADAAVTLESLVALWPKGHSVQTDLVAITSTTATINVTIDGDAQAFLTNLGAPPGWRMDEPRLSAGGGKHGAQLTIQFRRQEVTP